MLRVKPKAGRTFLLPSDSEETAIQAGIKADPDAPELGPEFFAKARPAREVLGDQVVDQLVAAQRGRGRPAGSVAAHTKKLVSLRLDAEVVEAARATGAGWQTRVNDLLRREFLKR